MALRVISRATRYRFVWNFLNVSTYSHQNVRPFCQNRCLSEISLGFVEDSQYSSVISLANLLERYGFPEPNVHDFLRKNQFLLSFGLTDVEKSLDILSSFKLRQKRVVSILSACPGVLELEFLKKWEMVFWGLGFSCVSPLLIQSVLEHCRRFHVEPTDLSSCCWMLRDLGFNDETLTRVLEEFPGVITMKSQDVNRTIAFFRGLGMQWEQINLICHSFPRVLGLGDRLKLLMKEFEDFGFRVNNIRKEIIRNPQILSMEVGELSRCLRLLRSLKCRLAIKEKILHEGEFRAGFEVKLRVDCLCRYGLIRREALKVLEREPRSLIYELKDIEKKIEFLIHRIGFNISCLVEVPEYLGVSFEKQIVPRYNVIECLRLNGGLGCEPGLKDLIKPSRLRFWNLYVKPYPECEKVFGRFSKQSEVRNQHPVGLWKLFKPQRYLETKDDWKNMKIFMDSMA